MNKIVVEKIRHIVNRILENQEDTEIQENEDLIRLGLDSMRFIQLVIALEDTFDCEILDSMLLLTEMNTIAKIYKTLEMVMNIEGGTFIDEK